MQKIWHGLLQSLLQEQKNYYPYFLVFREMRSNVLEQVLSCTSAPDKKLSEEIQLIITSPHKRRDCSDEETQKLSNCLAKLEDAKEPHNYSTLFLACILFLPLHKMPSPIPELLETWMAPFISCAIKGQAMISVTDDKASIHKAMGWVQVFAKNMQDTHQSQKLQGGAGAWEKYWLPIFGFDITAIDYYSTKINLADFVKFFGRIRAEAFEALGEPHLKAKYRTLGSLDKKKKRTRIALLCSHITAHGHGLPHLLWWITCMDKDRFELLIILQETATNTDHLTRFLDRYSFLSDLVPLVIIPQNSFESAKELDIDILYNTDDLCRGRSEFLAYKRMARHQVTGFYTPATTGCNQMDYYITSPDLDPNPDNAFTEQVIMSKGLPFCFHFESYFGTTPCLSREELGIKKDQLIITMGSSMTTKVRPEFAAALAKILKHVPEAICVAMPIDPQKTRPHLVDLFLKHCKKEGIDPARIQLLPFASRNLLHGVIKLSDVFLDFFPFSGTNNLLDPLMLGTPCISLSPPDGYSRNRIGSSILRMMGLDECIATCEDSFVDLAVKLCQDAPLRDKLRARMGQKAMEGSSLCDGPSYVKRMTAVFDEIMSHKGQAL